METTDPPRLLWQVHQDRLDLQILEVFRPTKIPPPPQIVWEVKWAGPR